MPQLLAEELIEVAGAKEGNWKRDQEAWNLPRAPGGTVLFDADHGGLDWEGFSTAYYPDSRRHNLGAIVAYGAYKRSRAAGKQAEISTEARSVHEGGTSQ